MVKDVSGDRTDWNLIVEIVCTCVWIYQLRSWKKIRKVSCPFRGVWNHRNLSVLRGAEARSLVAAKIKQAVFYNRTANTPPELILLQRIDEPPGEIIAGIERVVLYEFEHVSVNLVSS